MKRAKISVRITCLWTDNRIRDLLNRKQPRYSAILTGSQPKIFSINKQFQSNAFILAKRNPYHSFPAFVLSLYFVFFRNE